MTTPVLVAGVGNYFLGDDGFGTEVARRLLAEGVPSGVKVTDFGVGAVHLVYELLDGVDDLILVDAAPRGGAPGTVYVIEPELDGDVAATEPADPADVLLDAHSITPDAVLALVARLRGSIGRVRVVGCEPGTVAEGIGLSPPVAAAVDVAVTAVRELIDEAQSRAAVAEEA